MCGIAGFTNPGPDARPILAGMNAALGHRGPDGDGIFIDRGVALGHTRLAIIDLTGGAQPRVDEASGDALVYNGEIYGYRALADELRSLGAPLRDRSDTEVLFQLIRREGVRAAVERIDGMFAFAYRDGATGALFLVRDRFGEKPLYYGITGRDIVFASEVPALQCHPAFADGSPDRDAAYRFLLHEYLPGPVSGWRGIAKLEPGCILTANNGEIRDRTLLAPSAGAGGRHRRPGGRSDRPAGRVALGLGSRPHHRRCAGRGLSVGRSRFQSDHRTCREGCARPHRLHRQGRSRQLR